MNKQFKLLSNHKNVDLIVYIQNYIEQYSDIDILIGTDSQNKKKETVFANVVALRKPKNGCHVLYCKYNIPRIKINNDRLIQETWDSIEIAEFIREKLGIKARWIDIDINGDKEYASNLVLTQCVGMVKGMDYDVRYKNHPTDTPISTYCSDNLCR